MTTTINKTLLGFIDRLNGLLNVKNGLTGILILNGIEIDTALVTAVGQVRCFLKCYE
jgi:hypothetical protein